MSATVEEVWAALEDLADPEIPVISLRDLGILREVRAGADGLEVVITPTYSGCPAMGQIEDDLRSILKSRGISARRAFHRARGRAFGVLDRGLHWRPFA